MVTLLYIQMLDYPIAINNDSMTWKNINVGESSPNLEHFILYNRVRIQLYNK